MKTLDFVNLLLKTNQPFIMKIFKNLFAIVLAFSLISVAHSCIKEDEVVLEEITYEPSNPNIPKIVFTSNNLTSEDFSFWATSSNKFSVDWGNGKKVEYPANSPDGSLIKGTLEGDVINIYTTSANDLKLVDLQGKKIKKIDLKNAIGLETILLKDNKLDNINFGTNAGLKVINIEANSFKTEDLDAALKSLHGKNTASNPGKITIGDGADGNAKPTNDAINFAKNIHWQVITD